MNHDEMRAAGIQPPSRTEVTEADHFEAVVPHPEGDAAALWDLEADRIAEALWDISDGAHGTWTEAVEFASSPDPVVRSEYYAEVSEYREEASAILAPLRERYEALRRERDEALRQALGWQDKWAEHRDANERTTAELNLVEHLRSAAVADAAALRERLSAAEAFIEVSACDPDTTAEMQQAYERWREVVARTPQVQNESEEA